MPLNIVSGHKIGIPIILMKDGEIAEVVNHPRSWFVGQLVQKCDNKLIVLGKNTIVILGNSRNLTHHFLSVYLMMVNSLCIVKENKNQ